MVKMIKGDLVITASNAEQVSSYTKKGFKTEQVIKAEKKTVTEGPKPSK